MPTSARRSKFPHDCTHHRSTCSAAMPSTRSRLLPRSPQRPSQRRRRLPRVTTSDQVSLQACLHHPSTPKPLLELQIVDSISLFTCHLHSTPSTSASIATINQRLTYAFRVAICHQLPQGTPTPVATSYSNHSAYCRKNGTGILRRRCKSRTCD